MQKAFSLLRIKAVDDEQRIVTGIATTVSPDRMEDIVESRGAKFALPLPLLSAHDHRSPIGEVFAAEVSDDGIEIRASIPKNSGLDYVERAWKQIKAGLLKGLSIGFRALNWEPMKSGGIRYTEWEWYELSAVAVPANAEASITAIKQISSEIPHGRPARAGKSLPSKTGSSPAKNNSNIRRIPMSIAERISAKQAEMIRIKDRLTELKAVLDADDDENLTEEQEEEITVLQDQQATLLKSIESLEGIEAGLKAKAQPVAKVPRPKGDPAKSENPASMLFRHAACHLVGHIQRRHFADVAKDFYRDDDGLQAVVKTAVDGADTTTAGWASELVETSLQGFIDLLRPVSVYARAANLGQSFDFGRSGVITIPTRTSTSRASGSWVGEQGAIPIKALSLSSATLNRFKMAVISVMSKEITRHSMPQIESIVQQAIIDDTAIALDSAFLDTAAAVAGVRPAGIRNGVSAVSGSGASTLADIIADINAVVNPILAANGGRSILLVLTPGSLRSLLTITNATGAFAFRDEVNTGRLLGAQFVASTNCPSGTLIALDGADIATALGSPEFDASDTATLVMANADATAPTHADDGAGDLGTAEQVPAGAGISVRGGTSGTATGSPEAISLYQTWQTSLRMVLPISWVMTRSGMVQHVPVTW